MIIKQADNIKLTDAIVFSVKIFYTSVNFQHTDTRYLQAPTCPDSRVYVQTYMRAGCACDITCVT